MSKRKTLEERIEHRDKNASWTVRGHIADEIDRLARQVRKLKRECLPSKLRCHDEADFIEAYNRALADVLALIKEAKR